MKNSDNIDHLFVKAESLAKDFSLFPKKNKLIHHYVKGLLTEVEIKKHLSIISQLDIDSFIEKYVLPVEKPNRLSAKKVLHLLADEILDEIDEGPYYSAIIKLSDASTTKEFAVIAQNSEVNNGIWNAKHHLMATKSASYYARRSLPIITMIDTPGASADEDANSTNQAHSISQLIAEMCQSDIPTIAIIWGVGYSGGAIPLASCNLILSVQEALFGTIQPKGLASIAKRLKLSWQECAKIVGLSSYQLFEKGYIDGIIHYQYDKHDKHEISLKEAIISSITFVENTAKTFVSNNPYIGEYYNKLVTQYLNPDKVLLNIESTLSHQIKRTPTDYTNVFGVAYRYLRYLSLRKKIK